jgi:glycosyltransferase involved in cell wall biosynthesis
LSVTVPLMTARIPSASVVIPSYNAARWIGATLDSWAQQTDRDFEVILVDDGSNDGTPDIAESYQQRLNLRVLREPRRGAPAGPCNVGLRAAQGELIFPCDADDMATPDRIQEVRQAWERAGRRDCLIFTNFAEVDAEGATLVDDAFSKYPFMSMLTGQALGENLFLLSQTAAFDALLEACFIRPVAVAGPRRIFEAVGGFDEKLRNGQDYDIFLRLAQKFPFVWLRRTLALYRIAAGNISSRPACAVVPSRLAVLQQLLSLPLTPRQIVTVRATMARYYEALGYDQGSRGEVTKAIAAYAQAFRNDPALRHLRGIASSVVKGALRSGDGQTKSQV